MSLSHKPLRRRAGAPVTLYAKWNDYGANAPPTVATGASASPNPVTGTTTALSVLGADDNGEANLTYTWATTGTPPAGVDFSANGTNAAKNTTATFASAGTYNLQATITDGGDQSTTSGVNVTVDQTLASITVLPANAIVVEGLTQQYSANGYDQFDDAMSCSVAWSVSDGTITGAGLFQADTAGGPYTLTASDGSVDGTASVTVPSASADSDGDGMSDGDEVEYGYDPLDHDQDGNGVLDGQDDWDGDGTNNAQELVDGTNPGAVPAPAAGDEASDSSGCSAALGGGDVAGHLGACVAWLWALAAIRRRGR